MLKIIKLVFHPIEIVIDVYLYVEGFGDFVALIVIPTFARSKIDIANADKNQRPFLNPLYNVAGRRT